MVRPHVIDGERAGEPVDPRVAAVLEVLAGRPAVEVAGHWSVEPALLHRWVRAFVDAGTAQITNRPDELASRQRDRFLSAFAHEVRTPLSVALGWVSLLLEDEVPRDQAHATLVRLHRALDRVTERTVDVELMATASLGRLGHTVERVRVGDLVAGLEGLSDVAGADVDLVVDPALFRRVLRDLWQAAGTAPAPRGRRLDVRLVDPWVELRVVREGSPLSPTLLHALFEPFDVDDEQAGVTVGLYLVRALVVLHGGTVGVEQDDDTTSFWVRVPAQPLHPPIEEDR